MILRNKFNTDLSKAENMIAAFLWYKTLKTADRTLAVNTAKLNGLSAAIIALINIRSLSEKMYPQIDEETLLDLTQRYVTRTGKAPSQ